MGNKGVIFKISTVGVGVYERTKLHPPPPSELKNDVNAQNLHTLVTPPCPESFISPIDEKGIYYKEKHI